MDFKKIIEKTIEKTKKVFTKKTLKSLKDYLLKNWQKVVIVLAIIVLAGLLLKGIFYIAAGTNPYTITVDGEKVCFVRGESAAKKVRACIVETYLPEGTEVKLASLDKKISYKRTNIKITKVEEPLTADEAAQYIIDKYEKQGEPIQVKLASYKIEKKPYTPKPKYVKNEKMLAGETKVKKKGKDGKQDVTITYTSVNGKIKSRKITNRKVVKEGKPATVYKGVLGLPKGKNWKTFKGKPVYRDGREVVLTSRNYIGAPYKYGGYSLTKGIDCVQFVRQMYAKYGIKLPNSHQGLQHSGTGVSYKNAKKGDVICYGNHVGIYVGKGKMINAVHKGVKISKVNPGRIKAVRRIKK